VNTILRKACLLLIIVTILSSCSFNNLDDSLLKRQDSVGKDRLPLEGTSFENLDLPAGFDVKQFDGMTLNFIVENNPNATILTHESEEFSKITGINIKVMPMDYDTLVQKLNLDFISRKGKYHVIYVDPYQTLNRFHDCLEVLNAYNEDPNAPSIKGLTEDFFENQTLVCSYFKEEGNIYSVPFDSTTMILYYRKDIFDQYKDAFYKDKGYDWTPGRDGFTWEKYCEVAEWIDKNVPDEQVKYGSGHMAQEHNSIFCDFSNILAAYGGDYFYDENINTLGLYSFENINVSDYNFVQALDMYKKVVSVSAPQSVNWNWTDAAAAFRDGEIAMMTNWDENYTYVENDSLSKVHGKVGYAILPYGDERSANIYGGSGVGINKYASDMEKQAAWLYITWATSKEMQLKVLKHPEGGSLPTRKSAYQDINSGIYTSNKELASYDAGGLKHLNAVLEAWKPENIYLRPKISNFYEVEKVIISNLHEMVVHNIDSLEVCKRIQEGLEAIKSKTG
jgi:multiple sugar transport system substrate-binding protein